MHYWSPLTSRTLEGLARRAPGAAAPRALEALASKSVVLVSSWFLLAARLGLDCNLHRALAGTTDSASYLLEEQYTSYRLRTRLHTPNSKNKIKIKRNRFLCWQTVTHGRFHWQKKHKGFQKCPFRVPPSSAPNSNFLNYESPPAKMSFPPWIDKACPRAAFRLYVDNMLMAASLPSFPYIYPDAKRIGTPKKALTKR